MAKRARQPEYVAPTTYRGINVKRIILTVILALVVITPTFGRTRPYHFNRSHSPRSYSYHPRSHPSRGRIRRSRTATDAFKRQTGYPHGRPGYVINHVVPLACGGADSPSNMQWQTIADGKAKDKWERKGCR